ncbi:MAG: DUF4159 domain-containing protein [Candidatus Tectomicrobia bacterium]|uniref:DUF4159 domain-containing protein n=1 Tax=Tectimicrobiota bacterium TaxID=2528274 RepID=A0A933GMZ6_UNCTE|nr:DUF4159 domain-containing protein [Candidatus Tectomicrobia bacterium]
MFTRREFCKALIIALGFAGISTISANKASAFGDRNHFHFAQLKYKGGNWNPYRTGPEELLKKLKRETSVEPALKRVYLESTDKNLFLYPFLFVTGREEFDPWPEEGVLQLRKYLNYGGFMLVDDAGTQEGHGFDKSFRREVQRIFPNQQLKKLSKDHVVYQTFYLVRSVGGKKMVKPYLEGIDVGDLTPLIYSQNDLGGAWEKDNLGKWVYQVQPGGELQRDWAFRLGINIFMYAVTVNYKKDQIHIPFIMQRKGA